MKRSQYSWGIGALFGMLMLILDGKTALAGATEGLDLCIRSLVPSLFPFFVLSSVLTSTFTGVSVPILRPAGALLGIPAGCESLLIPAYLGGYPAGAKCIAEACRQKQIPRDTAQRLLLFCNNCGPSFLFGILGGVFPQPWMLWALWSFQIGASVLTALVIPAKSETADILPKEQTSIAETLSSAVATMGSVCGWVILFRILIAFLEKWLFWLLPIPVQVLLTGLLELSNGCCALPVIEDLRLRFLICSGMLSFGGFCVTMQTASVIGALSIRPYLISKGLQCLFTLGLVAAFLYHSPVLAFFCLLFFLFAKKVVAKRAAIVYNGSINQRRNPYAVS